MSHQLLDAATDSYTNILTVTRDHRTQTYHVRLIIIRGCSRIGTLLSLKVLKLMDVYTHTYTWLSLLFVSPAPSGPPMNVKVSIYSSSSILVNWSPPVGGADGYVILYSSSSMTYLIKQRTTQTKLLLHFLNEGHLYTIRVFAYKDLPSMPLDAGNIYFSGMYIVLNRADCPIMPSLSILFLAPSLVSNINSKLLFSTFDLSLSRTPPMARDTHMCGLSNGTDTCCVFAG